MGKISNMQQKQNNENGVNLSYARNQAKPRLDIRGFKGFIELYKPGIEKEYSLTKKQKKFIRNLRTGTAIAILASSLALTGGVVHATNNQQHNSTNFEQELDQLTKEDVLASAEDALLSCIYQDLPTFKDKSFIKCLHDAETNSDKITVYNRPQNPNADCSIQFSYTRYNNTIDKILSGSKENDPTIDGFLNSMIDLYNDQNISQEELKELNEKFSDFDFSDFRFDSKSHSIVSKVQEKDQNER